MYLSNLETSLRIVSVGPDNRGIAFVKCSDVDFVLLGSLIDSVMAESSRKFNLCCIMNITPHMKFAFLKEQVVVSIAKETYYVCKH